MQRASIPQSLLDAVDLKLTMLEDQLPDSMSTTINQIYTKVNMTNRATHLLQAMYLTMHDVSGVCVLCFVSMLV